MNARSRRRRSEGTKVFAGRYAYVKPLGRGAGGSVYLAEDLWEDRRQVALKVLSAEAYETVQGKMLRREFEILSKLDHPNLVRVYDYGMLPDGGVFLAEEYIDGFSLQDARALLEPAALTDLTIQVLQGLAYLHGMGMIHRDIKPANLMLLWLDDASARPMSKLVDFGLSSMDPKRDTLRGGTRSYMAPEVIRGARGERRSDLYSLGVTLYYALCGVLPFGPRTKEDPPTSEETFRPPEPHRLNDEVPLELSRFTMALLRQVPDLDYADAGEALQALAGDSAFFEDAGKGAMANSLDVAASPVIRGYFERGILARRIEEDDLLLEWLSVNAGRAQGQLYLITGPEGVGKTRLLQDVQSSAKLSGHLVLPVAVPRQPRPFGLILGMLTQVMELARSHDVLSVEKYETARQVRRLLTDLEVVTPGENVLPGVEQAWIRSAIEEAVASLGKQKVIFFIDELQRADEPSIEMLVEWFRATKSKDRPDVVATAEPGDVRALLCGGEGVQEMPIKGVTLTDVSGFFLDRLGLRGLSQDWLNDVARAARGRPSYIEEICRWLIDTGMLRRATAERWSGRVEEIQAAGVPGSTRESMRRRLTSVGAGGREALELLSLIGRPIAWRDARSLLRRGGSSTEEAERTLKLIEWRHLVRTELTTEGRFLEVLDRELGQAIVDMTSPEWRRALHRRIGELLAKRWQVGRGDALEAAHHLQQGGRSGKAWPFFELAGDLAMEEGEFVDAIAHYQGALAGVEGEVGEALLHVKLGRAYAGRVELPEARTCFERARGLVSGLSKWVQWVLDGEVGALDLAEGKTGACRDRCEGDPVLLGRCLMAEGDLMAAREVLLDFLAARPVVRAPSWDALGLGVLARVETLLGEPQEALKYHEQALEIAEQRCPAMVLGMILGWYGADLRRMGSPVEAMDRLREAVQLLTVNVDPDELIEALFQLSWTLTDLGSSTTARRRAVEAFCLAQKLGHELDEHRVALLLGSLVMRKREVRRGATEQMMVVVDALERGEGFVAERAEVLMALGDVMVTLQIPQGAKLLQRGREWAYRVGAKGLLPPVQEAT